MATDMSKTAMKLALEALETFLQNVQHKKAITALREALAEQPAQQSVERVEPVAWMHPDGRIWTFGRGFDKATFTVPLHTSPPQRKPLTDDQIDVIRQKTPPSAGVDFDIRCREFARAIEAAHGIKEQS